MEFQDVVRRRRMVRDYADTPVDPAVVDRALANAVRAPSAGFSQGWAFLVLDQPVDVRRFWVATADVDQSDFRPDSRPDSQPSSWLTGMMRAPVVIVPCSHRAAYLDRYAEGDKTAADQAWSMPYWHLDTAMASLLILQTAVDEGLGACFFGVPPGRETALRAAFDIPADHDPIGVIALGHRAAGEGPSGSPRRRRRRDQSDVVHRGRWVR